MKILVVEDNRALSESICTLLRSKGFQVEQAFDCESGVSFSQLGICDLLIIDSSVPGMDALAAVRQIRAARCVSPILMLSVSSAEDRIQTLNAGADYCLSKPFDNRELLACINALLRRQGQQVNALVFGNTSLDLESCTLVCGEKSVRLSAREYDVMRFLLQSGSKIISKEVLLSRIWGLESNAVENHVEVYVGFLRKKLAAIDSDIHIRAVRRLGYHLTTED